MDVQGRSRPFRPSASQDECDPTHYVPELSRGTRDFATWAMIKHLGRDGIAGWSSAINKMAGAMAARLRDDHPLSCPITWC